MRRLTILYLLALVLVAGGCGGKYASEEYMRDDVDLGAISRIAVLPFHNFSGANFVGERVRDLATTQLLALKVADVVDRGLVDSVMSEEVIDPKLPIDQINLKRLGQRLNVQAFLVGTIDVAETKKSGNMSYPILGVTLRLIDAQANLVIWQSSGRWTTETVAGRIFGLAPTDDFHVTLKLMNRMLRSLARE